MPSVESLTRSTSRSAVIAGLLCAHAAMLAWSAYKHSPVALEVGHLPAGISHWRLGRFDLYRVNPPLPRMVAALPILLLYPVTDWTRYDPEKRSETPVGMDFVEANGYRSFLLYSVGRCACIPFSLIGACVCYLWGRDLYGKLSGILSATLWCFCPAILGNAPLITPDAPAAALGLAACYSNSRWLKERRWNRALVAGLALGLAELTKTTLLIFYPLWIVLWLLYKKPTWNGAAMLSVQLLLSTAITNLGYGFEGTFKRIDGFQSRALREASLRLPLPENYIRGIDAQKADFERGMRSYLRGQWSDRGWWYFYVYALAIKIPLGVWALVLLAANVRQWSRDELVLLIPPLALLAFVSLQTGFSVHYRYALPALPFVFVWSGKTMLASRPLKVVSGALVLWAVGSSVWSYPHSLSYFNELVCAGHEQLLDSGCAWGQDLLYLKEWHDAHPEARPLYVASFGLVDPRLAGIEYSIPPLEPLPGWYAIDVNHLHGSLSPAFDGTGRLVVLPKDGKDLSYFLRFKPAATLGSVNIYHVTAADVTALQDQADVWP